MMLQPANIQKIAVFRALQLGDLLCAVPAFRALRNAYPDSEITLLGMPWAAGFVQRFSKYFDRFIHFPGYPGLPEQEFDSLSYNHFLQQMHDEEFDLLLQMQGNGTIVNPMLMQFHTKHVAGFYNDDSFIDSPLFMPYPDYGSEVHRHLALMQHLGISLQSDYLEFPLTQKDEDDVAQLTLPIENKRYVCVHPGSRGAWRQWPPHFFAALADYVAERGYTVIITGLKEEIDITREVIKCMKHPPIDLTGKTSLGAISVLIKNAFALISNCTGVSHIAAAMQTQSVVISMDGEPERWAPINKKLHHTIDWLSNPHFEAVFIEAVSLFRRHVHNVTR